MKFNDVEKIVTINGLNEYRKNINEALDEREKFIKKCIIANELKNGSFLEIKENFESLSPKLFKNNDGKRILTKYKDFVTNNANLSSMYLLFENIRKANKSVDLDFFMDSISNRNWIENKETLDKDISKLGDVLAEAYIAVGSETDIVKCDKEMDNAVKYICENKKTKSNISEYGSAVRIIKEHIANKDGNLHVVSENVNIDKMFDRLLNEFNEKYSNAALSSDELSVMREFCNTSNHEQIFENYKNNCTKKLIEVRDGFSKSGDSESVNKLTNILEQVNSKTYNSENVFNDVIALVGLSTVFDESK